MKQFHVYILTSRSGVLYTGVTNDLERRVWEHKQKPLPSFTSKYHCDRLVYYEAFPDSWSAIEAEKRIKGWRREKKIALIESMNPTWRDLSEGWYGSTLPAACQVPARKEPPTDAISRHPEGAWGDRGISGGADASLQPEIPRSPRLPRDDTLC
jgi:putative endonuclease